MSCVALLKVDRTFSVVFCVFESIQKAMINAKGRKQHQRIRHRNWISCAFSSIRRLNGIEIVHDIVLLRAAVVWELRV